MPDALTVRVVRAPLVLRVGAAGGPAPTVGPDLTAIEALTGTGILVRTDDGVWTLRQIGGPLAGVTVSNGDGVAGDPALGLSGDLAALEGLAGTGIARRTGASTWTVGTAVAVAEGGTGATTALDARAALGLVLGSQVQVYSAELAALAALSGTGLARRTGAGAWSLGTVVGLAEGGTGATDAAAARVALSLVVGTDVAAHDAGLASLAGVDAAADRLPYTSAAATWTWTALTAAGRDLLDDADATAQRATLGLGSAAVVAATASPTASQIPIATSAGHLAPGWSHIRYGAVSAGSTSSAVTGTTIATWTLEAGKTYLLRAWFTGRGAATTTGLDFSVAGDGTLAVSRVRQFVLWRSTGAGSAFSVATTSLGTWTNASTSSTTDQPYDITIEVVCTTGGVLSLQLRSEVGGSQVDVSAGTTTLEATA